MIQLIQAATQSQSNQHRKQAQRQIIQLRDINPDQFFQQSIQIFKTPDAHITIRQAAGTLIMVSILTKVSIYPQTQTKTGNYCWDTISGNMKNHVKNCNLELLVDPQRNVRRTAANVSYFFMKIVSAICFIQLPRKQWEGIVDKICMNVSHDSDVVKESSILTLGFVCSRMREQQPEYEFSQQTQTSILSGIVVGLQQTNSLLIETSLKALRDSISSLAVILKEQQFRQFVLTQLVQIINSSKYTCQGLQILGEFVKTCYKYLSQYMQGIIQILSPQISNPSNQQCCISAMQIWQNIACQYKDQLQSSPSSSSSQPPIINYITGTYGQQIVTSLLKNLYIMQDQQQNDDNPISDSASKALESIFQNGAMEYKELVLQFVKASIGNADWKFRQASVKGFSLLLHGLDDEVNQKLISGSINQLFGLFNDPSKQVQYATMESFIIITEVCGKFILMSPHFIDYLKTILGKITISQKFLKSGCKIIDNLTQSQKQSKLGKFNPISNDLIQLFLKYTLASTSSPACINWTTITIMNIIQVTQNQQVLLKYLTFILQHFSSINLIKQQQRKQSISSAFFTFMQFCLHGLKNVQLDQNIIAMIYGSVTSTFRGNGDVNADGMFVVEALVPFFCANAVLVNDFWVYVVHALTKWQDHMIFKATVCCIASFLNVYGELLADKLSTFVPAIIGLLENPNFQKQDKIDCLVLLGQVFLSCGKAAEPYLQKFLDVILLCCSAAVQMQSSDFQYSEQLKDNIIQTLMCIVHGLDSSNVILSSVVPQLFQFVSITCNKKKRPTVTYLSRCVLLLADLGKFFPDVVRALKQQNFVMECLATLGEYNKGNQNTPTIQYAKKYLK